MWLVAHISNPSIWEAEASILSTSKSVWATEWAGGTAYQVKYLSRKCDWSWNP